jgi:hypothetical protein
MKKEKIYLTWNHKTWPPFYNADDLTNFMIYWNLTPDEVTIEIL